MAGVASGLALATTLMAMQVADSMSNRPCPYHQQQVTMAPPAACDHGYLGVQFVEEPHGLVGVMTVNADTPAAAAGIQVGDHLMAIDGQPMHSIREVRGAIRYWHTGNMPTLTIEHNGVASTIQPRLVAWPFNR